MVICNSEKFGHRMVTFLFVDEGCLESSKNDAVSVWDGWITVQQLRKQNISLGLLNLLFVNFTDELVNNGFYFNTLKLFLSPGL